MREDARDTPMVMAFITIFFGIDLIFLGALGAYVASSHGMYSHTAWIPAGWGVALVLLGALALLPSMKKHAMHVAAMLGLIGAVAPSVMAVRTLMNGNPKGSVAPWFQIAMAVFCAMFLVVCIKSFIQARRARKLAEAQQ